MPPKAAVKARELEIENNELRTALDETNKNLEGLNDLTQQNTELKSTLQSVLSKLDQILSENVTLREQNNHLSERIEILEKLLTGNSASDPDPPALPSQPVSQKEKYHALVISDSIFRHVGADCPKKVGVKCAQERDIPLRLSKSLPLLKV